MNDDAEENMMSRFNRDMNEAIEAARAREFDAEILGPDGQVLSTGKASLDSAGASGHFWPKDPKTLGKIPKNGAILAPSGGQPIPFEIVPNPPDKDCAKSQSPHFHFRVVKE